MRRLFMLIARPVRRALVLLVALELVFALCSVVTTTPARATTAGVLGHSGRFYTINGAPASLIGIDMQELAANPTIDYASMLNALQANDVTALRLWIYPSWNPAYLQPWTYNGSGCSAKYNLDSWNAAYWTRLKSVVDAAQARGIYVELSIFSANYVDSSNDWSSSVVRYAYNQTYNCNGQFAGNAQGDFAPDFWNPNTSSAVYGRQKQLVDKVLATFPYASYQSLSFEICNEFPGVNNGLSGTSSNSQATNPNLPVWQNSWINYIKANNAGRIVSAFAQDWTGTNTNGITNYWSQPNVDTLDFHTTSATPAAVATMLDGGARTKNKILQDNETTTNQHGASLDVATQRAWTWNANGGYFKWYWDDSSTGATDPEFLAALGRLKVIATIDSAVDWSNLYDGHGSDVTQSPATGWRLLASHGDHEYLFYGWGGATSQALKITLTAATYTWKWIDPRSGSTIATGTLTSNGTTQTITQPANSSWNTTDGLVFTAIGS
jgi:hypothetical protein